MRRRLREEWVGSYELGRDTGEWTRARNSTTAEKPWYYNHRDLTNRQITDINRILSGRANNNLFKHRMRPTTQSPLCDQCNAGVTQTVPHTLTECAKYLNAIQNALDSSTQIQEFLKLALEDVDKLTSLPGVLMECGAPI
uniref:Protein dct-6 n=1 Tax=Lygus hesperus TaxID=30085 RepID=A0A0A9XRJ1_LYGHE